MYKRRYTNKKLNYAFKEFNKDELEKENFNKDSEKNEIKKIIKKDEPIKKLHKDIEKKSKKKPINTRILLKGWI